MQIVQQDVTHLAPTAPVWPRARDRELVRELQARLLGHKSASVASLVCAGCCAAGADEGCGFYDFLPVGPDRLVMAFADVPGSVVMGSLVTAALRTAILSHYAAGMGDLRTLVCSVNALLTEITASQAAASLFLAEYHDRSKRLAYVNCEHQAPILLRGSGSFDRLAPTASAVGLHAPWHCGVGEVRLERHDVLVIASATVTTVPDRRGQEFGDDRLVDALRKTGDLPAPETAAALMAAVRRFRGTRWMPSMALVVARRV